MKKILYLALTATMLPMAAMAGGMAQPVVEPVVQAPAPMVMAPGLDWSGAYSGASLGFGKVNADGGNSDAHEGIFGLNLGYRKDFGKVVLGGEVSVSKNDIGIGSGDDQINSALQGQVSLGADLGKTLVYVAGGVARANASVDGSTGYGNGYFAGIGADYMLNDKFTVGAEVKSSHFNDFNNSGINLKATSVEMKVGFRF